MPALIAEREHVKSISKLRDNCLKEFDAHWDCLEKNNQVCLYYFELYMTQSNSIPEGILSMPKT